MQQKKLAVNLPLNVVVEHFIHNTPLLSRWRFTRSRCSGGTKTCTYFVVSYQKSSYEKWTNFTDNCIAATVYAALYTRCRIRLHIELGQFGLSVLYGL